MIATLRRENLKHRAFVINGAPQVMRLAVDANEYLIQVPSPVGI